MNYSEIIDWLRGHEFEIKHSEFFHPNYVFCKKKQTNVVLKEYSDSSVSKQIRSDAVDIRSILNKIGVNVWNTYFLICTSSSSKSIPYSIEKDSVGLRKYVINSIDDFKRIPFLDITTSNEGDGSNNNEIKIHSTQNENLNSMIDYIISVDGLQRNLNGEELDEILSRFYGIEVDKDED
ncbi:ABC-three component system middle component 1 [Bacillus proteolyticus]|uniref:ABC-three component system middle component 1 n=1 Tax=Bacillus proteolyticus TaxID=2026192 RepID=UPI003D066B1C